MFLPGKTYESLGDKLKTFDIEAPLQLINETSVDFLKQNVLNNYPEGLENFSCTPEQFRSNIVISTKESF